jgi:hypothetical protein
MGYAGFLAIVPWIQAFIWSFKPTDIIDVRRWPPAEAEFIEEMVARMKGEAPPDESRPDGSSKSSGPDGSAGSGGSTPSASTRNLGDLGDLEEKG